PPGARDASAAPPPPPELRAGRMLTTPGGTPASASSSASSSIVSGVSDAGLITTVHPAASAGAVLGVPIAAGEVPGRDEHGDAGRLVLDEYPRAGTRRP